MVEERYADAQEGPGAVAIGGEDWKASAVPESSYNHSQSQGVKRERSPEDEQEESRGVCFAFSYSILSYPFRVLGLINCYLRNFFSGPTDSYG